MIDLRRESLVGDLSMFLRSIPVSEVEKKTGAEFVAYGTMGLNLGRGKKIT